MVAICASFHFKLKALFYNRRVSTKECGASAYYEKDIIEQVEIRADNSETSSWEDSSGLYFETYKDFLWWQIELGVVDEDHEEMGYELEWGG